MSGTILDSAGRGSVARVLPIEEKKQYLTINISNVPPSDAKAVCKIVAASQYNRSIVECNEGLVINLDILPADIIDKMYEMLVYKMERRT